MLLSIPRLIQSAKKQHFFYPHQQYLAKVMLVAQKFPHWSRKTLLVVEGCLFSKDQLHQVSLSICLIMLSEDYSDLCALFCCMHQVYFEKAEKIEHFFTSNVEIT